MSRFLTWLDGAVWRWLVVYVVLTLCVAACCVWMVELMEHRMIP